MAKLTLVTVVGPEGSMEVALPTTATIGSLIPRLTEICVRRSAEEVDPSDWLVGPMGGPPFPVGASVAELGVHEGDVLELRGVAIQISEHVFSATGNGMGQVGATEPVPPAHSPAPAWTPPPGTPQPASPPPPPPQALDRNRAALPPRLALGARIGAAAGAATAPRRGRPAAAPARDPATQPGARPMDLSRPRSPSLTARMRSAWHATDYRRRLDGAIASPRLSRCATIAVLSPKGGVGKTTLTALLGELFALVRSDRVIAIDTNPDFGSLGRILSPDHSVFVDDILEHLEHPALSITTLDGCLGRAAHGLMVLPAPTDPERMAKLDQAAYTGVIERLKAMVGIVVLDCGTGLWDPATRAAIACADQLVVVSDDQPATASLVVEACALLATHGPPLTLVLNRIRGKSRLDVTAVAAHVPSASGMVLVPHEQAAAGRVANGEFTWDQAPAVWQERLRELAALLVAGWPDLGLTAG